MEREEISGVKKAAILLLTMDEDLSKEVIRDLDESEIELIGQEISRLESVSREIVTRINEEFTKKLQEKSTHILGVPAKFKGLLNKSLGEDRAASLWQQLSTEKVNTDKFLKSCDPRILANTLKGEHPQTISLVLSNMEVKQATEVVSFLPQQVQSDVIVRMAHLERVDKKIIEEIEGVLKEQLESIGVVEGRRLGGVEVVASMLNQMNRTTESEILESIEESNPELAERIKQLMFTFEDLLKTDDKGIQLLLKEVSSDDLTLALKGASEALKDRILNNMSERAAKMLKEDLEAMGPVRVSDVEKAQVKIAMVAKKLSEEGKPLSDEVESLAFHDLTELPPEKTPEFRPLLELPPEEEPPSVPELAKESESLPEEEFQETIDVEQETRRVFEEAFAQGEKAGHEMGMKKVEPLIEKLNQYLTSIESLKQELLGRVERFATVLALTFAESIVLKECTEHREITLSMIRKALEACEERGECLVRLPKEDAWMISAQGATAWRIVPDEELKEPGFVIETNFGDIDGRISKQLEELKREFVGTTERTG